MRKYFGTLLAVLMSALMLFTACGGGTTPPESSTPDDPTPEGKSATITVYTTVNIIEHRALEAVADAYMDLQYEQGNDITVIISNDTDPVSYISTVRNMITAGVEEPTIITTSVAPEYYGTDTYVELGGYLEDPNPYIEGNTAWKDALDPDAYRTEVVGATSTIPGISYSSNYATVFYNKQAMLDVIGADDPVVGEDGTLDNSLITWSWMMEALEKARNSGLNFNYPLGLSTSTQSCGEDAFPMLNQIINMYLDQYFRDFTEDVHSQEGDFSYVPSVDADWVYDPDNAALDAVGSYTYNINKVVDYYFNNADYGPLSERYSEVMENIYDFTRYADPQASYNDVFSRFNETTLVHEDKTSASYTDMKLFYVEALGYVRTYRDAFKRTASNGSVVYPDAETITSELGWFIMPAMESELEGVADNVRAFGGPNEHMGVVNTGSTELNEYAIDFLQYLFSPAGQAAIYSTYVGENNAPIVMRQLVRGVEIPEAIDYTGLIDVDGDCTVSPYLIFGKGSGMSTIRIGETNTYVKDQVASACSSYFRGSERGWVESGYADALFNAIKGGFSNYAAERNFIYNDYTQVSAVTNGLVNSPYNTSN